MKTMKIAIASGKGGVGKSTLTSSLALLISEKYKVTLVDADVDCPDLQILFEGKERFRRKIQASKIAVVDKSKCNSCGLCDDVCKFGAIKKGVVNEFLCEGCGACSIICPQKAIEIVPEDTGEMICIDTKQGFPLIYAQLYPGKPSSGRLVYELRAKADEIRKDADVILIDSAPGIGCPVIASLTGCNYLIGVVEPTTASFEDLKRLLKVADYFKLPYGLVINKSGISTKNQEEIVKFAEESDIKILGVIPYDKKVIEALAMRKPAVLVPSVASDEIKKISEKVDELIKG